MSRGLTPELLLRAYAMGVFPMAKAREDRRVYWVDPDERGILPLPDFHVPRSLKKVLRKAPFEIKVDTAFQAVMEGCAESKPGRDKTWINDEILAQFCLLHHLGLAHSVECWRGGELVGGLYGLALGAAFFGESMFSRTTDASKVALVDLVARLKQGGYVLLDTQFITDHLVRFGAVEIPREDYLAMLAAAMSMPAQFSREPVDWRLAADSLTD
ncbi:Leucyl/phenylalanyl-tRNA--protein transferase [Magnetospirillum sp. LM-5]|uniref:leucyl/phenylalanyl-tRNA--protein transferase n=1 Tax=Magnetospirillum sp. LM-5 TaxID=2681466 RepID=UPI001384766E|nr:leucyl/phenylalanyl-tRNA--protein transferase [Magnetospirillum sp. LM-5]CAA7617852.1 Leucyl/phenylalanyl-tRNA--protein transferase [Magnetospirillum sp. LM-5]